jgi:hypothetical protein
MFDHIFDRMNELALQMRGRRYDGHHDAVMALIHDAEQALTPVGGRLGLWERLELDHAIQAVRINFLSLALNCIGKAIEVSQLPRDHYDFGFNYGKKTN